MYKSIIVRYIKPTAADYDGPPICECTEVYLIYEDEILVCAFTANIWVDTELFDSTEEFRMGVDFDNLRVRAGFLSERGDPCAISATPEKDIAILHTQYDLKDKLAELNASLKDWGAEERLTYSLTSDYRTPADDNDWFMHPPHTYAPKPLK